MKIISSSEKFANWLARLSSKDPTTAAIVTRRIERLRIGLGDIAPLGDGVSELRIQSCQLKMVKEFQMPNQNITSADIKALGLQIFDPAEYITSDEAAAAYINEALTENNAALLASAIGDVARARGMSKVAKSAGIARESHI